MSTTLIENLHAEGDVPSGEYLRGVGIITPTGVIRPVQGTEFGHLLIHPSITASDVFARMRVSQPFSTFDSKQIYAKDTVNMLDSITGGATATYSSTTGMVAMSVTTASGDKAVRQSRMYIPYEPGRSTQIMLTTILGTAVTNVRKRVGIFDDNNGFFLEQTSSGLSLVRRSNTTGSIVDTSVAQASWNIDALDGTGPSGVTLNVADIQLFAFDFTWLGAGEMRFGVYIEGKFLYTHTIEVSNVLTSLSMKTPVLPIRYEIENTAASAGATMQQICCAAFSEGGLDPLGSSVVVTNGATIRTIGAGSSLPLVAVRLRSGFTRGMLIPLTLSILVNTPDNLYYEVYIGASVTGGAWSNAGVGSEINTTGTAISGGTLIQAGYIHQNSGSELAIVRSKIYAASDFAGTTAEPIVVYVRAITTAADAGATLMIKELL